MLICNEAHDSPIRIPEQRTLRRPKNDTVHWTALIRILSAFRRVANATLEVDCKKAVEVVSHVTAVRATQTYTPTLFLCVCLACESSDKWHPRLQGRVLPFDIFRI